MAYVFRFEAILQEPFEEKALQYITDTDPVGLLKKCRKRQGDLKTGTRRLNWHLWTACYAGALGIRRQPNLFAKLLEDDYFKQRTYKADPDDLLRLALLIGTDADVAGATYKKACTIAARLQLLFDAEIKPMEVLARIEAAGGLNRLHVADVVAEDEPTEAEDDDEDNGLGDENVESGGDEDDDLGEDEEDGDNEDDWDEDDDELAAPTAAARLPDRRGSGGRRTTSPWRPSSRGRVQSGTSQPTAQSKQATTTADQQTREVEEGKEILEVEVTREMLVKVLNASSAMLLLKRVDAGVGWQRIVGVVVTTSD